MRNQTITSLSLLLVLSACSSSSTTINAGGSSGATGGTNGTTTSAGGNTTRAGTSGISTAGSATGGNSTGGNSSTSAPVTGGAASTVGGTSPTASGGATVTGGAMSTTTSGVQTPGGTSGGPTNGGTKATGGASSSTGGVAVGGGATSKTTPAGGSSGIGGSTGGVSAAGGAPLTGGASAAGGTSPTTGGASPTGGSSATGGSSQLVCSGNTPDKCSGVCTNLQSDKANCGTCGTPCQSYQFCAGGSCLPHYVSTKILPTTSLASDSSVQIQSAAVETNKAEGDLLIQMLLTDASVLMSGPSDTTITQVSANTQTGYTGYYASGLVRYTAGGTLVWGRDLLGVLGSTSSRSVYAPWVSPFVLNSTGDVMLAYDWEDPPPTGPVQQTSQMYLGRINSNNANLIWAAVYSTSATQVTTVVPRSAKNDYVTFGPAPDEFHGFNGDVWQVVENTTSGSAAATRLGIDYSNGALPDVNGSTIWLYGFGYAGTFALNPWSAQTWNITGNPSQIGGTDAFIIGVKDDGTSIGPWMSEGDWGPQYRVAMDSAGDLLVAASSGGYTTFNGGQDFITSSSGGVALVKINHTNGQIVWRTDISALPVQIIAAPGNRVVTMTQQLDSTTLAAIPTSPYQLNVYSNTDGTLLSSVSAGMMAQYMAAGTTDLFVLGNVSAASDFDPGTGTDSQGTTAGVYISRFSF